MLAVSLSVAAQPLSEQVNTPEGAETWHPAVRPGRHPVLGPLSDAVRSPSPLLIKGTASCWQLLAAVRRAAPPESAGRLVIDYPQSGTAFPPQFPAPTMVWHDRETSADTWWIRLVDTDGKVLVDVLAPGSAQSAKQRSDPSELTFQKRKYEPDVYARTRLRWRPSEPLWRMVSRAAAEGPVHVIIAGFASRDPSRILSRGTTVFSTSADPVDGCLFFRQVPLPFVYALHNLHAIRWVLGDVTSPGPPKTLLAGMNLCGNCHSFTPDGKTLAMDVDYGSDKGSYIITDIEKTTVLHSRDVISWSDYRRDDGKLTFGLLSQISPCGRYVISTVKDRSVFSPVPDFWYSQRFFPVTGILVVYDRETKRYTALPGAGDPALVQSNPTWSPDGKTILFARTKAYPLPKVTNQRAAVIPREEVEEFFDGGRSFRYEIWSVPFNGGKGGDPTPLTAANQPGRSSYFPKYSPDGRWIVFCRSNSFMLLQPDSELWIMPAQGGEPRRLKASFENRMNSWHSWSPNGRWLAYASKADGPYTQIWLTHIDRDGRDSPPVMLERMASEDRAANIPEFVARPFDAFSVVEQQFEDYYLVYREGSLHQRFGRPQEAREAFERALEMQPDHPESLFLLGELHGKLGDREEALDCARRLEEVMPESWGPYSLAGRQLLLLRRWREAAEHLEKALSINPGHPATVNAMAWLLATCPEDGLRDGERALDLASDLVDAEPAFQPAFHDTLAAALAESGDCKGAAAELQRVIAWFEETQQVAPPQLALRLTTYREERPFRDGPQPAP